MAIKNPKNVDEAGNNIEKVDQVESKPDKPSKIKTLKTMSEACTTVEETSNIMEKIEEIALQTKLLVMNATTEAVLEGDKDGGVAEVFDEVKNLAMGAAYTADYTMDSIKGIVKNNEGGYKSISSGVGALSELATSAAKTSKLIGELSEDADDKAQGMGRIKPALRGVAKGKTKGSSK